MMIRGTHSAPPRFWTVAGLVAGCSAAAWATGTRALAALLLLAGAAVSPADAQTDDAAAVAGSSVTLETSTTSGDSASSPADVYQRQIVPLLETYCYDCHGNGAAEGNMELDRFTSPAEALADPNHWWKVLKNLRSNVMPPVGAERPSAEEVEQIAAWIKSGPFQIRLDDPDPGRLAVRRLNRTEYGNTVRDLMGIDFDAEILFPPDDSGHGFDNIGDAMSFSPLLLEKYMQAAQMIVAQAVPRVTWIVPRQEFRGDDFSGEGGRGGRLDGKRPARVRQTAKIELPGKYRVEVAVRLRGSFDFDPARYKVAFHLDGQPRTENEYGWDENKVFRYEFVEDWEAGEHEMEFVLTPIPAEADEEEEEGGFGFGRAQTNVSFGIDSVTITGPEGTDQLVHPANYERFFPRPEPPVELDQRRDYAAEILSRFATRAYRGTVDPATLERLVAIAELAYREPGTTFEEGIARAMVAVLASPRYLFRLSAADPKLAVSGEPYAPVDELSLASRMSYFLWSTMPDDELFQLVEQGRLREELPRQVERMLRDERSEALVRNFVGQWLRTRDVTQMSIDPLVVLGYEEEFNELRQRFRGRFRRRGFGNRGDATPPDPEEQKMRQRFAELRAISERFDGNLRRAMQRETEMCFEYIVREDRSLLELIDSNYTFVNEALAAHYGLPDVEGERMRRVELPPDSPRGGVLTHASMLLVTSNPTRTSPVKRGLFVLDNILGTPAPPPPAAVPELEESAKRFGDREPTLRELLAAHRESALCSSCHARMDPIGLALENFNALGMWRDEEKGQPIDAAGQLITGEEFQDIRELKRVLAERHADDFYRCVTQKLLTYAIGRGLDYTDEHTVDLIVERLKAGDGKFSELLMGIIESAPFQKQRTSQITEGQSS